MGSLHFLAYVGAIWFGNGQWDVFISNVSPSQALPLKTHIPPSSGNRGHKTLETMNRDRSPPKWWCPRYHKSINNFIYYLYVYVIHPCLLDTKTSSKEMEPLLPDVCHQVSDFAGKVFEVTLDKKWGDSSAPCSEKEGQVRIMKVCMAPASIPFTEMLQKFHLLLLFINY